MPESYFRNKAAGFSAQSLLNVRHLRQKPGRLPCN